MGDLDSNLDKRLNANVLVARIVVGALAAAVVAFLGLVIYLRAVGGKPPSPPVVSLVGVAFAVAVLAAMALVATFMIREYERQVAGGSWPQQLELGRSAPPPAADGTSLSTDEEDVLRWWGLYQTQLIVRCALVEGAAFMQCIAYLIEGHLFSVLLAGGLLVILLSQWPGRTRSDRWIAARMEAVERLKLGDIP